MKKGGGRAIKLGGRISPQRTQRRAEKIGGQYFFSASLCVLCGLMGNGSFIFPRNLRWKADFCGDDGPTQRQDLPSRLLKKGGNEARQATPREKRTFCRRT